MEAFIFDHIFLMHPLLCAVVFEQLFVEDGEFRPPVSNMRVFAMGGGGGGCLGEAGAGGSGYIAVVNATLQTNWTYWITVGKGGKPGTELGSCNQCPGATPGGDSMLRRCLKNENVEQPICNDFVVAKGGKAELEGGSGGAMGGTGCTYSNGGSGGLQGGRCRQEANPEKNKEQGSYFEQLKFFKHYKLTAGNGGKYGGYGGGGGGGVLINGVGPKAGKGVGENGGLGGEGYGAGGGGGGLNLGVTCYPGGAGADGMVYIEWN